MNKYKKKNWDGFFFGFITKQRERTQQSGTNIQMVPFNQL